MKIDIDVISCIVMPVAGYFIMISMKKKARNAVSNKKYDVGIYKLKPVYGDEAIKLAHGYGRSGIIIFIFFIVLPFSITILHFLK